MSEPEDDARSSPLSSLRRKANPEEKEEKVLDPDNPLLDKFQSTLKDHLLRQIEHLKSDIFEYETEAKKKKSEKDRLGILVYEEQQIISKQQKMLENYISQVETVTSARLEVENVLIGRKDVHKSERLRLQEAQNKERELRSEVESVNYLIYQLSQWEDNLESDIAVRQMMSEKTRKDKEKLLEEKRLQDCLIYNLMRKIWHLESELDKMDLQIKVKEQEREDMAQIVARGNTNIEAIETEYRCLIHSWNSVVIAIGNRDKILTCLGKELNKTEEKFKSIMSEIEQIKKMSKKEMLKNEELTVIKNRIVSDMKNCEIATEAEIEKRNAIEKVMNEMQAIIDRTEIDIHKIAQENDAKKDALGILTREYDRLDGIKASIEEAILKKLEEQVTNDKASVNLNKMVRDLKIKNREMEIAQALCENKMSKAATESETQKFSNEETQKLLDQVEMDLSLLEKEADTYAEELKRCEFFMGKRQREIDLANNKLQKLIDKAGGVYVSPLEGKILTFEKNIEEIQQKIKKLQSFWMREQTNLLALSQERQDQIKNNNLLSKQIMVMEQKNLRVTDDLELNKKQDEKIQRAINYLQNRLVVLCDSLFKKKDSRTLLDKSNEIIRHEYVTKLKDAELECLRLQEEIEQVEEDKVNLSRELIELNREALEWEKKFKLAKETKENMKEEQSQEGQVGNMKAEIHRMNVRYSQLKKAQDKLIQDLEHCVSRRDAILTVSEAREKRVKGGMEKTRFNFQRKLDDMRNKIKQMENDIETIKERLTKMDQDRRLIENDSEKIGCQIEGCQKRYVELAEEIEDEKTERQMNFEMLLQLQKKLSMYTEVSKGRKPYTIYRTASTLTNEYAKQNDLNSRLCKIVENLMGDFPNRQRELDRALNTLKLPIFVSMSHF